jgi:DNA polymerase alpha subunit B
MAEIATASKENLNALFAHTSQNGLEEDVMGVLESILRLYSITAQELFYKWESYCLKMVGSAGAGNGDEGEVKLDIHTARMFSKDVRDGFEREAQQTHGKSTGRGSEKKSNGVYATPRPGGGSGAVFGM